MVKRTFMHVKGEDGEELQALFVETNLNTKLVFTVSPLSSFSQLREKIVKEHNKLFRDVGKIKINSLKVRREQKYYHLSGDMLLRTAFHGVKCWFVFAHVGEAPLDQSPKALSIPVRKLQRNMTDDEHVLNLEVPNDPSKNFDIKAGDNSSPGGCNHSKSKSRKKKRLHRDFTPELLTSSSPNPAENIHNNALEKSLLGNNGLKFSFDGGAPVPKQLVSKKDDLQKVDDVDVSNAMQSVFVETSNGCQMRKKKMRYDRRDTAGHVHNASSVSTDAKGTPALLGQLEGTGKIPCGDGVDKIHSAAEKRELTKQASKSKRKKHDHPSSNENETISLVSHQLQSEVHEAEQMKVIGVESFRPPQLSTPQVNGEIASVKPKKKMQKKHSTSGDGSFTEHMKQLLKGNTQKTVVEQADLTPNHKLNDADYQEKVSLHVKTHDGSPEEGKPDNQPLSNLKAMKLDLSSSVDISPNGPNLIISNSDVSERNAQAGTELQSNVQESELWGQIGKEPLPLQQISQHEEHLNVQTVEVVKPVVKKPTFSANNLSKEEQRDFLLSNGTSNATKPRKGESASEGHYNDLNGIPSPEVSSNLAKTAIPKKLQASEQTVKNTDLPMSTVVEFKGENLTMSTSSKHVMEVPLGDTVNFQARRLGQSNLARKSGILRPNLGKSSPTSSLMSVKSAKTIHKAENVEAVVTTPSNKNMGIPVSSVAAQKKTLLASSGCLFSDILDSEVERSDSSNGIRTVYDSSSSDNSEGESEGGKVSSQHESEGSRRAREEKHLSALKGLDIQTVLRSSHTYKKALQEAKLQSRMEDGETEPVEFSVPDSLSDS